MGKHKKQAEPEEGPTPEPVFAPAVPEKSRALLTKNPQVMVPPSRPAPKERSGIRREPELAIGIPVAAGLGVGAWFLLRWILTAALPDGLAVGLSAGIGAVAGLMFLMGAIAAVVMEPEEWTAAREWHGQYVSANGWDEEATAMMLRAQHAVRTVQESEVNKRGLLDAVKNDVVLPEQLWDLGRVLEQVSVLRTQQKEIGEGLAEDQLDQIFGAQRRALRVSVAAMEAKVAKLEQYAGQVRNADAVLRAEAAAALAAADTDRYVELLASTEASAGSALIDQLSMETKDLHAALTTSLAAALETGHTLALPSDPPPRRPRLPQTSAPPDREKS